ncbi:MAG TPA: hypothetical protein PKE13_05405 [Hyphomicrobium zavarzinii]|nr:hypothetical protein [Hyphomicrobium zavarzinii]
MPAAAAGNGIVGRFFGWILRALAGSKAVRGAAPDFSHFLPALFLVRQAPKVERVFGFFASDFSISSARRWALAARLRSIARLNVPKGLKGARRRTTPPAGKPIPKKAPRLLKRYKQTTGTLVLGRQKSIVAESPVRRSATIFTLPDMPQRALRSAVMSEKRQAA